MSQGERDDFIYKAKLAEKMERYDDMVKAMKQAASINPHLTAEERNLLSVAYKNVVGPLRATWRVISNTEQEEAKGTEGAKLELIKQYRVKFETKQTNFLHDFIEFLDSHLLKAAMSSSGEPKGEAKVFYLKMKGDSYRFLAEFQVGSHRKESVDNGLRAYEAASDIAMADLLPTHVIRLGLALNFSVFCYEILNSPGRACDVAKMAFDDAIAELDSLSDDVYKDSTLIMQLLRDNLNLWTSDKHQEKDDSYDVDADNL